MEGERVNRYRASRREMLAYIPSRARTLLDVGSANGGFGGVISDERPEVCVWGIDPQAGESSRRGYQTIISGHFPDDMPAGARFDCVVMNDVLEHMVDPWSVLKSTAEFLEPEGCVVASVPNIRHLRVVLDLALRGRWDYQDDGVLDRTHLRFFTKVTILEMFQGAGFDVKKIEPVNLPNAGRRAILRRISLGALDNLITQQYAVVAVRS